jgi:hypothetical protein
LFCFFLLFLLPFSITTKSTHERKMSRSGIWQLRKLKLQYCDFGGSSRGMRYQRFPPPQSGSKINLAHPGTMQGVFGNAPARIPEKEPASLGGRGEAS